MYDIYLDIYDTYVPDSHDRIIVIILNTNNVIQTCVVLRERRLQKCSSTHRYSYFSYWVMLLRYHSCSFTQLPPWLLFSSFSDAYNADVSQNPSKLHMETDSIHHCV